MDGTLMALYHTEQSVNADSSDHRGERRGNADKNVLAVAKNSQMLSIFDTI